MNLLNGLHGLPLIFPPLILLMRWIITAGWLVLLFIIIWCGTNDNDNNNSHTYYCLNGFASTTTISLFINIIITIIGLDGHQDNWGDWGECFCFIPIPCMMCIKNTYRAAVVKLNHRPERVRGIIIIEWCGGHPLYNLIFLCVSGGALVVCALWQPNICWSAQKYNRIRPCHDLGKEQATIAIPIVLWSMGVF